ncbi:MAG TPA: hypothetical protein VF972_08775 [Actinomycetota bacterium]
MIGKVLVPELAEDQSFRDRLIRESELAASLEHPNTVPIYDAGEAKGVWVGAGGSSAGKRGQLLRGGLRTSSAAAGDRADMIV